MCLSDASCMWCSLAAVDQAVWQLRNLFAQQYCSRVPCMACHSTQPAVGVCAQASVRECVLTKHVVCLERTYCVFKHVVLLPAVPIDAGPGASFFLIELLLGQPSSSTVKATCDSTLWVSCGTQCLAWLPACTARSRLRGCWSGLTSWLCVA